MADWVILLGFLPQHKFTTFQTTRDRFLLYIF